VKVHPTALVDLAAKIAEDVEIGPFCVVGPEVELGPGCRLLARVRLEGKVTAGRGNVFHPNAVIGGPPQDLGPAAKDARIDIGHDNVFRESVTVNLPKVLDHPTRIGSRNRFHAASHVGHDCRVGDDALLYTHAVLGGHTVLQDGCHVEGLGGTHQFVTIGRRSWTRSHIPITEDVPPFMWIDGNHFEVKGVNPAFHTDALEKAFTTIWKSGLPRPESLALLEKDASPEVRELVAFLRASAGGRNGRAEEARRG
jgi:UDP-N-acetylglucosamine acyltransferase